MIGLDTNVIVRFIAQDDPKQSPEATALINTLSEQNPGFITLVTLVELVWVMQSCYQTSKNEIVEILESLIATQELRIENIETVIQALRVFSQTAADFSDCLIERSASQAGCDYCVTFDAKAIGHAGFKPL